MTDLESRVRELLERFNDKDAMKPDFYSADLVKELCESWLKMRKALLLATNLPEFEHEAREALK